MVGPPMVGAPYATDVGRGGGAASAASVTGSIRCSADLDRCPDRPGARHCPMGVARR